MDELEWMIDMETMIDEDKLYKRGYPLAAALIDKYAGEIDEIDHVGLLLFTTD